MSIEYICMDALEYMADRRDIGAIVTGIPDANEVEMEIPKWREWFLQASMLTLRAASPTAPIVFCITDRKNDGGVISKAQILHNAAERLVAAGTPMKLLWHKIVLRREVGGVDLRRPGYSHLIAYSQKARPGATTTDLLRANPTLYNNATPSNVAEFMVRYAGNYSETITDPFCGRGTITNIAASLGYTAIGIDIDPSQIEIARAGAPVLIAS